MTQLSYQCETALPRIGMGCGFDFSIFSNRGGGAWLNVISKTKLGNKVNSVVSVLLLLFVDGGMVLEPDKQDKTNLILAWMAFVRLQNPNIGTIGTNFC